MPKFHSESSKDRSRQQWAVKKGTPKKHTKMNRSTARAKRTAEQSHYGAFIDLSSEW